MVACELTTTDNRAHFLQRDLISSLVLVTSDYALGGRVRQDS